MKRSSILVAMATSCCAILGCDAGSSGAPSAVPEAAPSRASAPAATPHAETQAPPAPPDVGAAPADAEKTPTGLATKVLAPGTGKDHPGPYDNVKVSTRAGPGRPDVRQLGHHGRARDLRRRRSSSPAGPRACSSWWPARSVACGSRLRSPTVTSRVAARRRATWSSTSSCSTSSPGPKPPPVPEDVSRRPASATKTASGLAYRVLTPGSGTREAHGARAASPSNYSGWTPTERCSTARSCAASRRASRSTAPSSRAGRRALQLMTRGEKARFWIPAALAYGDKPTRPGARRDARVRHRAARHPVSATRGRCAPLFGDLVPSKSRALPSRDEERLHREADVPRLVEEVGHRLTDAVADNRGSRAHANPLGARGAANPHRQLDRHEGEARGRARR